MTMAVKGMLGMVLRFILGVKARLPLLSAAEQTKLSWARAIRSYNEIPELYRSSFEALVGDTGKFPYAVLTPSYAGFIERAKEKLVCYLDAKVYVLEEVGGMLSSTCYPVEDISYIETGKALLQSWVKIRGTAGSGRLTTSEFKFNTVTEQLFTPMLERIRPAANRSREIDPWLERAKFDYLSSLNLKLMNYARRSVMSDEEVVYLILQPEIRAEVVRLFGHSFFRTRCSPHLSILTDRELILIQDGTGKPWGGDLKYGGVWNYIPLNKITSISLTGRQDDLLTLSIHLPGDDGLDCLFSVSNRPEIDRLLSRFEAISKERFV
ncbi:MAG: hypothetical protein JXM69_08770 [Anaerolineae bacterium]|nr:hypothetical protein [Anaerolineae bacterium]